MTFEGISLYLTFAFTQLMMTLISMNSKSVSNYILIIAIGIFPSLLFGRGSHGSGVMAGFTHPILGIDHAIAIFGVGLLGGRIKPSQPYLLLIGFLIAMIIGGLFGI
ncbi:MAG: HupE/UreJ family protein, partial [Bacteroidota bacterium]